NDRLPIVCILTALFFIETDDIATVLYPNFLDFEWRRILCFALSHTVDDLQVAIGTGGLGAEKHGRCLTLRASNTCHELKAIYKQNYAQKCTTFLTYQRLHRPPSRSRT